MPLGRNQTKSLVKAFDINIPDLQYVQLEKNTLRIKVDTDYYVSRSRLIEFRICKEKVAEIRFVRFGKRLRCSMNRCATTVVV